MGVVLDSSVVIAAERRGDTVTQLLERVARITGEQRAVLSSVGLTELVNGVHASQSAQARGIRETFLRELLRDLSVYSYTQDRTAGRQDFRRATTPRHHNPLLIGATALEVGYSILTLNVRHFRLIPGLTVVQF